MQPHSINFHSALLFEEQRLNFANFSTEDLCLLWDLCSVLHVGFSEAWIVVLCMSNFLAVRTFVATIGYSFHMGSRITPSLKSESFHSFSRTEPRMLPHYRVQRKCKFPHQHVNDARYLLLIRIFCSVFILYALSDWRQSLPEIYAGHVLYEPFLMSTPRRTTFFEESSPVPLWKRLRLK